MQKNLISDCLQIKLERVNHPSSATSKKRFIER